MLRAQLVANGQKLTVSTASATATFQGPDLVALTNALTQESYLKLPTTSPLADLALLTPSGQALRASGWTISPDPLSGVPRAALVMMDSARLLILAVEIDPASQEIVIQIAGKTQGAAQGVASANWTIAGLDLSAGRLILPAHNGVVFDQQHNGSGTVLYYPGTWNAQAAVYETALGSMVLYSTDTKYLSKDLRIGSRSGSTLDVSLLTEAIAPWPTATSVPTTEWRIKAFAGDWRAAASVYRDWLRTNFPPAPDAAHAWVHNITTVVRLDLLDPAVLDTLAASYAPSQTLLYLTNWRSAGYDVNYPDYTPAPGVAALITKAHSLGFRIMLHTDSIGASPGNPDYAGVQQWQTKDPRSLQLQGWMWTNQSPPPNAFAYISPAASAYRKLFIARVGAAVTALQPDALHLDVSSFGRNDGNGPIEGLTYAEGMVQLHKDLAAAFPNLALGGEGMNDTIYPFNSFAQSWWGSLAQMPLPGNPLGHPITTFLFNSQSSGQVEFYGHLSQPEAGDPGFKDYVAASERRAVEPNVRISNMSDLDLTNPDIVRFTQWMQSWQANGFQPAWTADWTGALIRYQGANGSAAALSDSGTLIRLDAGGSPLYQRVHNANQIASTSYIPYWPAYDATQLYGLDPTVQYWLDPVPRPNAPHISSLPSGTQLGSETMVTLNFAKVEVASPSQGASPMSSVPLALLPATLWGSSGDGAFAPDQAGGGAVANVPVPGRFTLFLTPGAAVGTTSLLTLPFGIWKGLDGQLPVPGTILGSGQVGAPSSGGVKKSNALFAHPPTRGRTIFSWTLALPSTGMQLSWSAAVGDGSIGAKSVQFSTRINGVTQWTTAQKAPAGWAPGSLDLSPWQGQSVLVELVTDAIGDNTGVLGWWADLMVTAPGGDALAPVFEAAAIGDGASYSYGLAPGMFATLFGRQLSNVSGIVAAASLPLPYQIAGVSVTVNGIMAPLYGVVNVNGQEQINFQAPWEIAGQTSAVVVVNNNGHISPPVRVPVAQVHPGLFTSDGITAIAFDAATYHAISPAAPATRGQWVGLYAAGLGPTNPPAATGAAASTTVLSPTALTPTATVGGMSANVLAAAAPGFAGLYQLNIQVPAGAPSGNVDVAIQIGGQTSRTVKLAIQ